MSLEEEYHHNMIGKLALVLYSLILSLVYMQNKKKNKYLAGIAITLLLLGLSLAFSYREILLNESPGGDYLAYEEWFNWIDFSHISWQFNNIGFDLLISMVKLIKIDFHFFLFICGFIINYFMFCFINKNSNNFSFSMMIYVCFYYLSSFNIMRQWIACAIFLCSIQYIIPKKFFRFLTIVVIASFFHSSALFLIVLYPVLNLRMSLIRKGIFIIGFSILIKLAFDYIFIPLLQLSAGLGMDYLQKYQSAMELDLGNYMPFIICTLVAIGLTMVHLCKLTTTSEEKYITYVYMSVGTTLLNPVNIIFNRMSVYFFVSLILGFPIFLNLIEKKEGSRNIFMIAIGGILVLRFIF